MSEPDFAIASTRNGCRPRVAPRGCVFRHAGPVRRHGRTITRSRLNAPGKFLPIIHPERAGRPGEARIVFAGNAATKPKLEITYREKGAQKPTTVSRDLNRIDASAPTVIRAVVTGERVREIELQVEPKDDKEPREPPMRSTRSCACSRRPVPRHVVVRGRRPRGALDRPEGCPYAEGVSQTSVPSPSRFARRRRPSGRIVGWDRVIGPDDAEAMVRTLAAFPRSRPTRSATRTAAGSSRAGAHRADAVRAGVGAQALRRQADDLHHGPAARQRGVVDGPHPAARRAHATDPQYRAILKKINVILVPVQNPDGAAMAYELQKLTPTHMLHAGATAPSAWTSAHGQAGSCRRPRSKAVCGASGSPTSTSTRTGTRRTNGCSRSRDTFLRASDRTGARAVVHDDERPSGPTVPGARGGDAGAARVDRRGHQQRSRREGHEPRTQDRYARWAHGFSPHVFGVEVYKDVMVYYSDPRAASPGKPSGGRGFGRRPAAGHDRVVPAGDLQQRDDEAPDETAQGAWLDW